MNKPLPDGGVALPTSETGQRRVEIAQRKRGEKHESQIRTHLMLDSTLNSSLTKFIQYNMLGERARALGERWHVPPSVQKHSFTPFHLCKMLYCNNRSWVKRHQKPQSFPKATVWLFPCEFSPYQERLWVSTGKQFKSECLKTNETRAQPKGLRSDIHTWLSAVSLSSLSWSKTASPG